MSLGSFWLIPIQGVSVGAQAVSITQSNNAALDTGTSEPAERSIGQNSDETTN